MIRLHEPELNADLRSTYGVGLYEVGPLEAVDLMRGLPPTSRLAVALKPDTRWPPLEVFLSRALYALEWLAWTKTKDAQKGIRAPEPLVPEALKPKPKRQADLEPLPIDQLERKLRARRRSIARRTEH